MEKLWAPWRKPYVVGKKEKECVFCQILAEGKDKDNYILLRKDSNYVILNSYPYNAGHLMVVPFKHTDGLNEFTDVELTEHFRLVDRCISVLQEKLQPQGFNAGINLGEAAGAGIRDHIHTHIVPRWVGDSNFMPVISNTKVISASLTDLYDELIDTFQQV